MADDQEEWMPFGEAVAEMALAYSKRMHCEPAAAIDAALKAVFRTLATCRTVTRSPNWTISYNDSDIPDQHHWADTADDVGRISDAFWTLRGTAELNDDAVVDWVAGDFHFEFSIGGLPPDQGLDGFAYAASVEIRRRGLPIIGGGFLGAVAEGGPQTVAAQMNAAAIAQRRTRTPKWDWEGAISHVVAHANANPDGLPTGYGAQKKICEMMADWFGDQPENLGNHPANSELALRAAKVMEAIETFRK